MSSIGTNLTFGLDLDPKTAVLLTRFSRRRRRLIQIRAIAAGLLFLAASMIVVAMCDYQWVLSEPLRWMLSIFAYGTTVAAMWWFGFRHLDRGDPRQIARQLESVDENMREDLLSAVELADPAEANGSPGFRHRLQRSVARRAIGTEIGRLLPVDLIIRWLISGLVMLMVCSALMFVPKMQFGRRIARALLPGIAIERASLTSIEIVKPSPPSGYVAEGDAVGVTVKVDGSDPDDVWLQWKTEEAEGESLMTPRIEQASATSDGTLRDEGVFAANVSVGSIPLQYRVMAGDAITLWHDLTPLPRPRVASFSKRYVFPEYAALPDRVEESEHGDVKALVGTMAEMTIRFDQPVNNAKLKYGNQGATVDLDPIEGTDREFRASIPIRTPATYQVDATSAESGLNNPFSPQYTVTPIVDTPPTAQWADEPQESMIVSPLQVVSLGAIAIDDLPMERLIHEYQVNDGEVQRQPISIDQPQRELLQRWDWDLLQRGPADKPSKRLRSGDIVRMRMVAIDRKGQRGESTFIELLVAEEGFDSDRHFRLQQVRRWAESVTDWLDRSRQLMTLMKTSGEKADWLTIENSGDTAINLIEDFEQIYLTTIDTLGGAPFEPEAAMLELIGRSLLDHRLKLLTWFDEAELEKNTEQPEALIQMARQLSNESSRIEQLTRASVAEYLTASVVMDARALDRSLDPLLDKEDPLPVERFPRYLAVTTGRMQEIDELISQFERVLPDSTIRHLEVWERMSRQWQLRFDQSIERNPSSTPQVVSDFRNQLRSIADRSMVDGRLSPTVVNLTRDLRFQIGGTGDQIFSLDRAGREVKKLRKAIEESNDSAEVAALNRRLQKELGRFARGREQLLMRLEDEEQLHRRRPKVDLQYAADLDLIRRAIENVTENGYEAYREESPELIHQKLARAFQVIEAEHEANGWLNEIRALLLSERQLEDNATTKILHATWIERVSGGLDWPARTIHNFGDSEVAQQIDRARYGDAFNESRSRITQRRWSGDPMLSVEGFLDELQKQLAEAIQPLDIPVLDARETIRQYVLDLAEQAREAAAEARESESANRSREDSKEETLTELQEEHQEAVAAAEETVEALIDYANTIDVTDAEQRELARDADAAAAKIQSNLQQADRAMKDAEEANSESAREEALDQAAAATQELAEALDQTAAHFEKATAREDLSESRQALRDAEEALQMQQQMQDPYERTADLAEDSQSTPQELLERLEQELQTNQPMQEELSDIAEQAAENAARTLENSARQERQLNQSLQRSDSAFQEQKRQVAEMLDSLAKRTETVDNALIQATRDAAGIGNAPEWRPKIDQARDALREAGQRANQLGGENALLSEMQETASQLGKAAKKASEILDEVNNLANAATDDDMHKDATSRKRAVDQLQREMRDARSIQLRAANRDIQQWSGAKREASRRVQQAQRQKRDAENRRQQIEDRLERESDNQSLKSQLEDAQRRVEETKRQEKAARETVDFADQQYNQSKKRSDQLKKQQIPKLEENNPAAETATAMTEQASAELETIQQDLNTLAERADFEDELRLPVDQSQGLMNQQERIAQEVGQAVEQLRRAARHEERLGRESLAEKIDSVAEAVEKQASQATTQAAEALEQATDDNLTTPQADAKMAEAAEMLQQAADQVGQLMAEEIQESQSAADGDADAQPQAMTDQEQQGQQLARTLDELDRALNASSQPGQQGDPQNGDPQDSQAQSSESQQPSGSQSDQQQPGQQPSEQQGQGQPQTAGEASQTLSDALAQEAQDAARQRGEQLQQSDSQSGQAPSQDSSSNSNGSNPGSEPGSGEMPSGGDLESQGVQRLGSDWGQLRERRTEDASESRGATIAPQYRREIEAYFRAVARQAAEARETGEKE
ncbi:MAG: hypothetical protein AAGI63_03370 [Planctomycetota bacterium]